MPEMQLGGEDFFKHDELFRENEERARSKFYENKLSNVR